MQNNKNRKLVLEDGTEYYGYGFGSRKDAVTELVFNTSPVGYQEILSDPSYTYQTVVMAYPLIGNYGINDEDFETKIPTLGGFAVHDYNDRPSNFRSKMTLSEVMEKYDIPGIYGIDTRKLVRSIRDYGSRKVLMADASLPTAEGIRRLQSCSIPHDAVPRVSRKEIEVVKAPAAKYHVVAIDCGMKENIVRSLNRYKCNVTIVPFHTSAEEIKRLKPDGVFISNGPGDPRDRKEVIETIQKLKGRLPIFGICLGHQMIALACGAETYKLKFGHRGGNHPVKNIMTGRIEITSQNHSYAVDGDSVEGTGLSISHMNLLDNTVEGLIGEKDKVFSVQYHPESAPGPQDSAYLFEQFINMMEVSING